MTEPPTTAATSSNSIAISPVRKIHSPAIRNKLVGGGKSKNPPNVEALKEEIQQWLTEYRALDTCVSIKNQGREKACTCCKDIPEPGSYYSRVLTNSLFQFGLMDRNGQMSFVLEWIKYTRKTMKHKHLYSAKEQRRCFLLPGLIKRVTCCRDTLSRMIGFGWDKWNNCEKIADGKRTMGHGNDGKKYRSKEAVDVPLNEFFEEMKQLACPRATLFVRELIGATVHQSLRNTDDELLELPSCHSKRQLFGRYVRENGYQYSVDAKGAISCNVPLPGVEQKPVCSWAKFHAHWKKHYKHIVVCRPREDVCNECFKHANRHKFVINRLQAKEQREAVIDEMVLAGDEEDDDDPEQQQQVDGNEQQEIAKRKDEASKAERTQLLNEQEVLLAKIKHHVTMYNDQRELFQQKKALAISTKDNSTSERTLCFVADYAQNMGLPSFGFEQPGETYYYSPLNTFCFGVVDASVDKLGAYVYTEDVAKKGGNNVASLLWMHLQQSGILYTTEPYKELSLFFDNCPGQNKNNMVIRLILLLVKLRVAETVMCCFLIRGHTKNDCDRLFNLMKKNYRKANIYLPEDMVEALTHEQVQPVWVSSDDMFDFDQFENQYMYRIKSGVDDNHMFVATASKDNGATFAIQEWCNGPTVYENLQKKSINKRIEKEPEWDSKPNWLLRMKELKSLDAIGVQDIKWIELHDKWGPLIPEEKKKGLKWYHEDPGKERREKVKNNRKASKGARAARSITAGATTGAV